MAEADNRDAGTGASATLSPTHPLLDEVLTVRVTGLPADAAVSLRVRERH